MLYPHDSEPTDMSTQPPKLKYLLFDVESIPDGELIAKTKYPDRNYTSDQAVAMFRQELLDETGKDFIPFTYHLPVALVIAKIRDDFSLMEIVSLDEPLHRPEAITKNFWLGWEKYAHPTLVTFNGRGFDIPLMELSAYRFGVSAPAWFNLYDRTYSQNRNRYNFVNHPALHEILTNFGSTWFRGGLNLAAAILKKPGKIDVQGDMVLDLHRQGRLNEISEYCRCDVLDTYFVFLRLQVLMGRLDLAAEQDLIAKTRAHIESEAPKHLGYQSYLQAWDAADKPPSVLPTT